MDDSDNDLILHELDNLPVTSSAFSRLGKGYTSVVDRDPTSEPPKKSPRLQGQLSVSSRSTSAKGKGRARDHVFEVQSVSHPKVFRVQGLPGEHHTIRSVA